MLKTTERHARVVSADNVRRFSMMGIDLAVMVEGTDTGGAYSIIEQVVAPGAGSPPHILLEADKVIRVLEGRFRIGAGDEAIDAGPGGYAILPRGVVHNFKNIGDTTGRIVVTVNPAGHEDFLAELAEAASRGRLTPEVMSEVGRKHHIEMVRRG